MSKLVAKHEIQVVPEGGLLPFFQSQFGTVDPLVILLGGVDSWENCGFFRIVGILQIVIYNLIRILSLHVDGISFFLIC